jgi:hypothetical protein
VNSDNKHPAQPKQQGEVEIGPAPSEAVAPKPGLPFSRWWPFAAGAAVGMLLRLIFSGDPGGAWSAMSWPFITLAPFAVSAVTVYAAKRHSERTWMGYFAFGALANAFFVLGTLVIMIEGLICAIIIVPLFMLYGGIGGLIMGAICKWTNWPKSTTYGVSILPVLLALFLPATERTPKFDSVERSAIVHATEHQIWSQLMNAKQIQPYEVERGWLYRIGVPPPEAGVTRQAGAELIRDVTMGKSIHFEQRSTQWRANEFVRWRYRFTESSFPPQALDDHVKIGGDYFDILDTTYTLTPRGNGTTELKVVLTYRVSTDFDWYANAVAQLLIGNFAEVVLDFYRSRAEGKQVPIQQRS